jgi:glycosyltransferase involved in cell wall biosynthesis
VIPKQIIFLTPGFPSDESDTTCIPALQDFVLGWKKTFPEIKLKVISFQYPNQGKKYKWMGIPVYAAGGRDRPGIFRTISWVKVFLQLLRTREKNQSILISYFLTEASFTGQLFSRLTGVKQIAIAAGQDVKKENPYLHRIDLRKLAVVAFNQKMADELFLSSGKNTDYIIPMGYAQAETIAMLSVKRDIDILIAGSLIPLKRIDLAIKIIAKLKEKFPAIKTEIIGKGDERKNFEKLRDELNLETVVSFTGELKREVVLQKMRQGKILLHCSAYEGQATVITEAIACGMTVVCFDVGRIGDNKKIYVCSDENEMLLKLERLFSENQFDFSPVKLPSLSDTVAEYWKIIDKL